MKKLIEPGEQDLGKAFDRLSQMLKSSGELAEVQFDIVQRRTTQQWSLSLEPKAAAASNRAARRPDFRVIVAQETWQRIAEGALSPLDAYLSGQLRIRGDTELAKRLLKRVAGHGETDICC